MESFEPQAEIEFVRAGIGFTVHIQRHPLDVALIGELHEVAEKSGSQSALPLGLVDTQRREVRGRGPLAGTAFQVSLDECVPDHPIGRIDHHT